MTGQRPECRGIEPTAQRLNPRLNSRRAKIGVEGNENRKIGHLTVNGKQ